MPAILRQGESLVSGRSLDLVDQTRDLTASGEVHSVMLLSTGDRTTPARHEIKADSLDYRDESRTATYTGLPGVPVVMTGTDGETRADRMVLTLARESRSLDRLDARGDVRLTLQEGREAIADTLLYEATVGRYSLRGQPLVIRMAGEKPGSCSLWKGRSSHFTMTSSSGVSSRRESGRDRKPR